MAFLKKRTIIAQGHPRGVREEGKTASSSAIKPGMAVEITSDNEWNQPASALAAYLKKRVCVATEEVNAHQGKTVDDAYPEEEQFSMYWPLPGEAMNVLVKSGENISVGDVLSVEGGGSGLFVEGGGGDAKYLFEALESSGGALSANALCRVRTL